MAGPSTPKGLSSCERKMVLNSSKSSTPFFLRSWLAIIFLISARGISCPNFWKAKYKFSSVMCPLLSVSNYWKMALSRVSLRNVFTLIVAEINSL